MNQEKKGIRVVIADDHLIVREGLRLILETDPEIELVGDAPDGFGRAPVAICSRIPVGKPYWMRSALPLVERRCCNQRCYRACSLRRPQEDRLLVLLREMSRDRSRSPNANRTCCEVSHGENEVKRLPHTSALPSEP